MTTELTKAEKSHIPLVAKQPSNHLFQVRNARHITERQYIPDIL